MRKWIIYKTSYRPSDPNRDLLWRVLNPHGQLILLARTFRDVQSFFGMDSEAGRS